jgi:hypothetical protein
VALVLILTNDSASSNRNFGEIRILQLLLDDPSRPLFAGSRPKDSRPVTVDEYAERLAAVRQRFTAKLNARLDAVEAALPRLAGQGPDAVTAVEAAHHQVHLLCGLAPTVGFARIGDAARKVERLLLEPFRNARALTGAEVEQLKSGLATLRAEANRETAGAR